MNPASLNNPLLFSNEERPKTATLTFGILLRQIKVWHARSRQRDELARLSLSQLDDIGITADQVLAEARKPFWKE